MKKNCFFLFIILLCGCFSLYSQNDSLIIIHTNDTHSSIEPFNTKTLRNVGGISRREAFIRQVKKDNKNVLVVDAGDFSQGTPYFNVYRGFVEVDMMNEMGYDVAALGNHEFDNGSSELAKRLKKAHFDVVCSNYDFRCRRLKKIVKPFVIKQYDSLKVGIFGLTTDMALYVGPAVYDELVYQDAFTAAALMVHQLRTIAHCDLVVCLSHLGLDRSEENKGVCDMELARNVKDIDIIIGGHSHTFLPQPQVVENTRIYQVGSKGLEIGLIHINKQ